MKKMTTFLIDVSDVTSPFPPSLNVPQQVKVHNLFANQLFPWPSLFSLEVDEGQSNYMI